MLYEILKTSKLGASFAPDMYTALWAQKLARDGEVKTLSGIPPLTFRSNGQPLLDYLISGNTVQNGTPTPDNPIMPQGTGERTGNLCPIATIDKSRASTYSTIDLSANPLPAGTYTLSANISTEEGIESCRVSFRKAGGGQIVAGSIVASNTRTSVTVILSEPCYAIYAYGANDTTTYAAVVYQNIMLNSGSTALPYEPYGIKIPISSGSTTTPVYLGEVETTRRIKKFVLTGNESINYSSGYNRFSISIPNFETMGVRLTPFVMSHYIVIDDGRPLSDVPNNAAYSGAASDNHLIFVKTTSYTSSDGFKSYLSAQYAAGTPVTVWYVLATEETAVVNEPLMKIGEYADTVSYEQAGVQIPTARGTNTLDVLTDVKPSEIYIKYKE